MKMFIPFPSHQLPISKDRPGGANNLLTSDGLSSQLLKKKGVSELSGDPNRA